MRHQQYRDRRGSSHRLDLIKDDFSDFCPVIGVKLGMLYRHLTNAALDGIIIKVTLENMIKELHLLNNICLTIICTSGHCGFLEGVSLTFIEKTDPCHLLKKKL